MAMKVRADLAIANIEDAMVEGGAAIAIKDTAAVQLQGRGGLDANSHWLIGHRLLQSLLILVWHILKPINRHCRPAETQRILHIIFQGLAPKSPIECHPKSRAFRTFSRYRPRCQKLDFAPSMLHLMVVIELQYPPAFHLSASTFV